MRLSMGVPSPSPAPRVKLTGHSDIKPPGESDRIYFSVTESLQDQNWQLALHASKYIIKNIDIACHFCHI